MLPHGPPSLTQLMTAMAFDTLRFAKRLKEAGFTEQQVEALAIAEAELIEDNLATKRDLKDLEGILQRDLAQVEAALKRDLKDLETKVFRETKELEYRMTIKLGTLMVVAIGAMATLAKLL